MLDYICNMTDDIKAHYMLIQVTQDQNIINICGTGAQIIMIDLDTNEVHSYNDLVFPDNFDIANADDARNVLYNAYDSYLQGWSDSIWMPVEEIISPMAEEEISQINSALSAHFTK